MKQFKLNYILCALALTALFSSCRKDNNNTATDEQAITSPNKGIFVLCEGNFQANNSSLTYYDYVAKTNTPDQFFTANNRGLGDTGNDVQVYGSKMYIVVNLSNTVEVVDTKTAASIKKIEFKNGEVGRQPRYIVFNKNKAYVSTYDGNVAVVDTTTLIVEKYIKVGSTPEKMAIANGKLYVANSGGLDVTYANNVSVIDLASGTETKKITVGLNPRNVAADKYGDIYVLSTGDYATTAPSMSIISSSTDLVTKTFDDFSASGIAIKDDFAYITSYDGTIKIFNVSSEAVVQANFITDGTVIKSIYGINIDPATGEVFVTDAKDYISSGEVTCFNSFGRKRYSLTTGISPNTVVFISK